MVFTSNSRIINIGFEESTPVKLASDDLIRDIQKRLLSKADGGSISIIKIEDLQQSFSLCPECFHIEVTEHEAKVFALDELGAVYGIYYISRRILGISDFWFWMDQQIQATDSIETKPFTYTSKKAAIKYRGWFINDETLFLGWNVDGDKGGPWYMAFETLLRLGGNLVIPGTDKNSRIYRKAAADRGLYITHHHAEPLGAEMFARAYPDLTPSFSEHSDLYRDLWREGIICQSDCKVVWNLGFRGQGDRPFWLDDPKYDTPQSRGRLISDLIMEQYNLVQELRPGDLCCTNLYGETMELYQQGFIDLPEDVIMIWADNGFGKMVSRRQGNNNPRVVALPPNNKGSHGLYYHASFYDLQAASHITGLPNGEAFVASELSNAYQKGVKDYWIINCSNIKPHISNLDLIAKLWADPSGDVSEHLEDFAKTYFDEEHSKMIAKDMRSYTDNAISYGPNEDDKAGDQFYNHVPRILISSLLKNTSEPTKDLKWLCDFETFEQQNRWCHDKYVEAQAIYDMYMDQCKNTASQLEGAVKQLYEDTVLLQATLYWRFARGSRYVTITIQNALEGNYEEAFYWAGRGKRAFSRANDAMRKREHDKWQDFYSNECQTDVKQTAYLCGYLMSYVRNLGEGPHFYEWQRKYQDDAKDAKVMLVLNFYNHLTDDELWKLMDEYRNS